MSDANKGNAVGTVIGIYAKTLTPVLNAKANLGDPNDPNAQHPMEPATMTVMVAQEDKTLVATEIPIVTSNSICGNMRRLLLKDLLSRVGVTREQIAAVPKEKQGGRIIYHTLFSGGTLGLPADVVPDFSIAVEREFREEWPALSLLGASIGQGSMITAKLGLHSLLPASTHLQGQFPASVVEHFHLDAFDPASAIVRAKNGNSDKPSSDIARSRAGDRLVGYPESGMKKAGRKDGNNPTPANAAAAAAEEAKQKENNIYRPQIAPRLGYMAAGTPLLGWVQVDETLTDVELGVLGQGLALLRERGRLGGLGHLGFGRSSPTGGAWSMTRPTKRPSKAWQTPSSRHSTQTACASTCSVRGCPASGTGKRIRCLASWTLRACTRSSVRRSVTPLR